MTRRRIEGAADHRAAMEAAYELGVAKQQLIDMEQRMAPPSLRKQLAGLMWMGLIGVMLYGVYMYGEYRGVTLTRDASAAPLPTAAIATQRPAPTAPTRNDPPGAPDYGQAAYNAQQQERAATFATQDAAALPAPTADEAEINAWLEAPPSTPTPLPEPGAPGFVESFEDAPQCSPFVGYLAGDPCIAILAGEG